MAALVALLSALVLGGADFVGGVAARRAPATAVVVWSNAVGLLGSGVVVAVLPVPVQGTDVGWGALAGTFGSVGAVLLYRALALGSMSLVAPATAAAAAIVPVVGAALLGERLTAPAVLGVAGALVSLLLISHVRPTAARPETDPRGLAYGVLAGVSFGGFLVLLAQASVGSGLTPLVAARCASLVILLGLVRLRRLPLALPRPAVRPSLLAGVLDMSANVLFLVAARIGSLGVVGLLSSLSPLGTVLLARVLLNERLRGPQRAGAALALASVVVLSLC